MRTTVIPLLLAASLALALPTGAATHSVCHNDATDVDVLGVVGVDDPNTGLDGKYACVGYVGVGVDEDLYAKAGTGFGATVRVVLCEGLSCRDLAGNTGFVLLADPAGPVCVNGTCYRPYVCYLDSACPP